MDAPTSNNAPPSEASSIESANKALHRFLQTATSKSPQEILDVFADSTTQLTAEEFLARLPSSELTQFQYFDDSEKKDPQKAKSVSAFVRDKAKQRQGDGCGVFFSVNGFREKRKKENLALLRGFYIDWDAQKAGAQTLAEVTAGKVNMLRRLLLLEGVFVPHVIIETKGGLHCLWLVEFGEHALMPEMYTEHQGEIVTYFGADPGAKDVTRVLRLPGFFHLKDPKNSFLIRFLYHDLP